MSGDVKVEDAEQVAFDEMLKDLITDAADAHLNPGDGLDGSAYDAVRAEYRRVLLRMRALENQVHGCSGCEDGCDACEPDEDTTASKAEVRP